jgi:acyl-CoA hydrolase
MRLAMEQAFAAAYLFTGERPVFRAIDEINFLQPVSIGTICTFNSRSCAFNSNLAYLLAPIFQSHLFF